MRRVIMWTPKIKRATTLDSEIPSKFSSAKKPSTAIGSQNWEKEEEEKIRNQISPSLTLTNDKEKDEHSVNHFEIISMREWERRAQPYWDNINERKKSIHKEIMRWTFNEKHSASARLHLPWAPRAREKRNKSQPTKQKQRQWQHSWTREKNKKTKK